MAKYSAELTERICSLIRADSYTIAEICKIAGIAESTFYEWKDSKAEFSEAIKKAQEECRYFFATEAKKSLLKLVQEFTVEEKRTVTADTGKKSEDGKPIVKVKEHTTVTKYVAPNPTAIIFTLTNCDAENWKNRQSAELTGKGGKDLIPPDMKKNVDSMTPAEIAKYVCKDGK